MVWGSSYVPLDPVEEADYLDQDISKSRDRTVTGLSLMIVAFALGWIPYVNYLGDLLGFIGIILLLLGRWGFDDRHHGFVVGGTVLLVLVFVATIIVAFAFASSVVSDGQSGDTSSQLLSALQGQLDGLFTATAVLGAFVGVAYVLLPYGLADRTTKALLWTAFTAQVVVSFVVLEVLLPMVNNAVSQSVVNNTVNTGPISSLQTTAALLGTLSILPLGLFAFAYFRARRVAQSYDSLKPTLG